MSIGFPSLAVVFSITVLAFDMIEQSGTERAAPPRIVDLLGVALSAVGARGKLS